MGKRLIKYTFSIIMSVFLVGAYPASSMAASSCPSVNGTTKPTGSSASTFTFNSQTCVWENSYYTWDPVTKVYTPKFPTTYTYNPADGQYEYTDWVYNTADGKYEPVVRVKPQPAQPAPTTQTTDPTSGAPGTTAPNSVTNTGANSTNGVSNSG